MAAPLDRLEAIKAEIEAGGGRPGHQADVAGRPRSRMIRQAIDTGAGGCAGQQCRFQASRRLRNLDPQRDIRDQINVNLIGTILASRAVLPHMIERRSGHIINMCSLGGLVATPTYTAYAATKFGVRGFSQALRREVRVWGIQVSAIYPFGVATEFGEKSGATKRKTGVTTPAWLRLSAQDVGDAIVGLTSRPRADLIIPRLMRFSVFMNGLIPGVYDRVMTERFVKPERGLK
jgi:short-subunit dehydrogenase